MGDVEQHGAGWSGGDPGRVTGWTLVRTHHAVARRFTETLARAGLTPTQFGVLVEVVGGTGVSQAELARRVLVTPQSIGELLTSLERLGYISRRRGPRGTASEVRVTDAGRAALDRATPLIQAMNSPQALGLTPPEDTTLNALLHKVLAAMKDS
ncbi:MarR family winged helix-turn-helix transcriptional regulator [Paractinoplanes ferrugineus]|uniref:MarR family winged helix-turn-helix transcriptional regulator n=1 Tax=Paractinoplanes ferrugineus TaxID=113564 RepID=UPI0019441E82|nr:MarR family winged helix-turn-helix transcriptional regulator [Actinoplanes ferrugineus]